MGEKIDIYDASLRPIGQMDRVEAHRSGQWHRTFHCWIVDTRRQRLLFQTRAFDNATHPGKLDITAAGHLRAGETVEEGIREVEEELGLRVDLSHLIFAGERVEVSDSAEGVKNREYQSVYFMPTTWDLTDFHPRPSEVAGLAALPIADACDLFTGRVEFIDVETINVGKDGTVTPAPRHLTLAEFIPRIQRYYLAAAIAAERICEGRRDIAIS